MRTLLLLSALAVLLAGVLALGCSSSTSGTASYYNRNTGDNCAIIDDWRDYCPRGRNCAREEVPQ